MDNYINALWQLFVLLFTYAVNFKIIIGLVITCGVFGGLITLLKTILLNGTNFLMEYVDE